MPLQPILLTSPSAFSSIAHIKQLAFQHNTLNKTMYGSATASTLREWFVRREAIDALNPCQRIVGVLDTETGEVVAYAKWALPLSLASEGKGEGERFESDRESEGEGAEKVHPPAGIRLDVWERFREELDAVRGKYLDSERDFCLHSLATRPDYQGKGCGTMILKWGIEKADEVNARCYLEATPDAYPLYYKVGFRDVDEVGLDLKAYGEGIYAIKVMAREARCANL